MSLNKTTQMKVINLFKNLRIKDYILGNRFLRGYVGKEGLKNFINNKLNTYTIRLKTLLTIVIHSLQVSCT